MPAPTPPRSGWTRAEVATLYRQPLFALIEQAHDLHCRHHPGNHVQLCRLLSIKTGGCPEDCAYCPQSARHATGTTAEKLMDPGAILAAARQAQADGATRFCMGAAWREVKDGREFDQVLAAVRAVAQLGMEVCCTLGMLTAPQAARLAAAGLTAYNHNLDTSPEFYGQIIHTRSYAERLRTLDYVGRAGISICCGGILGMGESEDDRIGLLHQLVHLPVAPESVPINALVPVPGTPLAARPPLPALDLVRAVAAARILLPGAKVRLSAGRLALSPEAQALCFYAGANSIFTGEKLLTTPNPETAADLDLLARLGLHPQPGSPTAAPSRAAASLD
ncbi:MAG: biotin synthase BioB [Terriglobales bacterium]